MYDDYNNNGGNNDDNRIWDAEPDLNDAADNVSEPPVFEYDEAIAEAADKNEDYFDPAPVERMPQYQYTEPDTGKKRSAAFKAVVACLMVVAILGASFLGGMAAYNITSESDTSAADTNIPDTDTSDINSNDTQTQAVTPVSDGSVLSGSEIYALACQQVVSITSEISSGSLSGTSSGTGFVYSEDGYIITNYHVVSTSLSYSAPITVSFYNGDSYEATYVGGDSESDVAVLKIDATGLNPVTMGDSNSMSVGEDVYVIGNALGTLDYTLTSGLVSALDRDIELTDSTTGIEYTMNMFQIDAAVNSGNSGGPVYNAQGQVIGIVTAKYSSDSASSTSVEGLGFAIPINDAASVLGDLIEYGYVTGKAQIGVNVGTVDSSATQYYGIPQGAYVESLTEGGAAEAAGVKAQDIITKLGDKEVASASDLKSALKGYSAGDTVTITVYRSGSGETLELSVTLDEAEQTTTGTESQEESSDYGYGMPGSNGYDYNNPFNYG